MRKLSFGIALVALAVAASTACASKGFVKTQVGQVDRRLDSLMQSLEQTQERVRVNEGRINEVDQRAQAAAGEARAAAGAAQTSADAAAVRASAANEAAVEAAAKSEALDKASKRLAFEVVLSASQGNFKLGKATLPDEAKVEIDELMRQLKDDPKGAFLEIEGHTDNVGDRAANQKLGLARAEAVKRYLYDQHQIPLHKMSVISYGADNPLASNKTKEGRAQNRAVVIRVLN